MEKIKGSYDDLNNKIRPGTTFVPGFTLPGNNDDLRAIDTNGTKMHFIPASRYYASCTIKRGQALSIAQLEDLTEEQKKNKYPYVKITDPDIDDTCIGIAMNYAEEGQIVNIQSSGKFNYYTTDSILYTASNQKKEIFLNANGWEFDRVRGQKLYIKKLYNNITNAEEDENNILRKTSTSNGIAQDENGDAFDTDHNDKNSKADNTDFFTYNFINSIYNVKNTIQIGYLTDAPTEGSTYTKKDNDWIDSKGNVVKAIKVKVLNGDIVCAESFTNEAGYTYNINTTPPKTDEAIWLQDHNGKVEAVDDFLVTIELNVTGDTRGPIDNTQFILTLGESIYFNPKKQDVDLTEPYYNEGVLNEIKVVAYATGEPTPFTFRVFCKVPNITSTKVKHGFIAIRKLDGDTYIIPIFSNDSKIEDYIDIASANDEGYLKLSKQFTSQTNRVYIDSKGNKITRAPKIIFGTPINSINRDNLKVSLTKALSEVFVNNEGEVGVETTTKDLGDNGFIVTANKNGGYYDIYVSEEILNFVSVTQVEHGQEAEPGTVILADIRDGHRTNIAGVVISNQAGVHKKGETVKVLRLGRIVTLGNLMPGKTYYLGLNGSINARAEYWYDRNIPIGYAESKNYFIVDVAKAPQRDYAGNFPLGYIKSSVLGNAEKGFVLADGITTYSKERYPELYNLLLNWFDEEELKPSNVTQDDFKRHSDRSYYDIFNDIYGKMNAYDIAYKNVLEIGDKIESFDSSLPLINTKIENLEKNTNTIANETIPNLTTNLNNLKTELEDANVQLKGQITTLNTNLTSLSKTLDSNKEELSQVDRNLKVEIQANAQDIVRIENEYKNEDSILQSNINTVNDNLNKETSARNDLQVSLQKEIETLSNNINNNTSNIEKNATNINTNSSSISDLQDQIDKLSSTLESLLKKSDIQIIGPNNKFEYKGLIPLTGVLFGNASEGCSINWATDNGTLTKTTTNNSETIYLKINNFGETNITATITDIYNTPKNDKITFIIDRPLANSLIVQDIKENDSYLIGEKIIINSTFDIALSNSDDLYTIAYKEAKETFVQTVIDENNNGETVYGNTYIPSKIGVYRLNVIVDKQSVDKTFYVRNWKFLSIDDYLLTNNGNNLDSITTSILDWKNLQLTLNTKVSAVSTNMKNIEASINNNIITLKGEGKGTLQLSIILESSENNINENSEDSNMKENKVINAYFELY